MNAMQMKKQLMMVGATLFALSASAALSDTWTDPATGIEWSYNYDKFAKTANIIRSVSQSAIPSSTKGAIVVPSAIGDYTVTIIGYGAFKNCSELTSVTIPSTVTNIGAYAFMGCSSLTSVTIPSGMLTVDDKAFKDCTGLKSVSVPSSVTSFGNDIFDGCNALTSVTVPGLKLGIDFSSVTNLVISDGTKLIQTWAFRNCSALKSVTIPASVLTVGNEAFDGCSAITSVTVPGWQCEINFASVKTLVISEGTLAIKNNAFKNCSPLTSVTIPSSVLSIGDDAFYECSGLTGVTLPEGVTSIGATAFAGCTGLKNVTIPSTVTNIGIATFSRCTALTSAIVSEGVTALSANMFMGCSGLESVTIPSTVTSMGNTVQTSFSGCTGMREYIVHEDNPIYRSGNGLLLTKDGKTLLHGITGVVVIPDGVTTIVSESFDRITGLTQVTFPSSLKTIKILAFKDCLGLTSVTIPSSVTDLQVGAFDGCTGLTSAAVPGWGFENTFTSVFPYVTNLLISEGTTNIQDGAFLDCTQLKNVTISASVKSIGANAFVGCSSLTNATFMGNAPILGENALAGTNPDLALHVQEDSFGWLRWNGYPLVFEKHEGGSSGAVSATLTVTNVVLHYIVNSIVPERAIPASMDTGFVNIITEIKSGGAVSVPETWKGNFAGYENQFGTDFVKSLMKPTGKYDGAGNALLVWQDYVAGTDPTDVNDVFTASITMVDGQPVISYSPELSADETALRQYVTWGKVKLQDKEWVEVKLGDEGLYNFFKVSVEMK